MSSQAKSRGSFGPYAARAAIAVFLAAAAVAEGGINPGSLSFPPVTAVFGGGPYNNNGFSAMCVACHTRNASARTLDNTGLGSHFIYGGTGLNTGNLSLEKITPWTGGGSSKYGQIGGDVSVVGQTGEMICESCHSMKFNTGVGKLLVQDNEVTDPSALCEGCHARTGPGHHIMTGEASTLHPGVLSTTDDLFVRNPPLAGSEATYPAANGVNCRSCHKPHDAQTQTGARILKRGYRTGDNAAVQGDGVTGIERTTENSVNPGTPVVKDFEPLCNACHKASY